MLLTFRLTMLLPGLLIILVSGNFDWIVSFKWENAVIQLSVSFPLTLNAPITTKVVCFSLLLKCLKSLYGKQCGPRSDCSYRSSLFWVHAVCFYTYFVIILGNYLRQTTSADDIFRCISFLGALRVNVIT